MAVPVSDGYLTIGGSRTWYRILGDLGRTGPTDPAPMLLLHGGPGGPWPTGIESIERLAEDRPLVFYDQHDCGRSDRPGNPARWTLDSFVDELGEVREQLGLSRIHLFGWSWGGLLALAYLLGRPAGVESVVLTSPVFSTPRWVEEARRLRNDLPAPVREAMERFEASYRPKPPKPARAKSAPSSKQLARTATVMSKVFPVLGSAPAQRVALAASRVPFLRRTSYEILGLQFMRKHVMRVDPIPRPLFEMVAGMNRQMYEAMWGPGEYFATGSLRDVDLTDRLGEIELPTLVVSGRYDEATPEQMRELVDLLPHAEWVLLEESSHSAPAEEPERYTAAVRDFLAKIEAAA
jgi:pimeloyl-ACP methyl ester carboxylesterase